jgi:thiol-disulfide isomerase/thioredoxin
MSEYLDDGDPSVPLLANDDDISSKVKESSRSIDRVSTRTEGWFCRWGTDYDTCQISVLFCSLIVFSCSRFRRSAMFRCFRNHSYHSLFAFHLQMVKLVAVVWTLAAIVVLIMMTLSHTWTDLMENAKDIVGDIRNEIMQPEDDRLIDTGAGTSYNEEEEKAPPSYVPVHSIVINESSDWDHFLESNPDAFVDFYASWCVWCQRLLPTWVKFAEKAKSEGLPVAVAHVDCVANVDLCKHESIMAFPTMRWYHNGEPVGPDYKMDRTVDALMQYATTTLEVLEVTPFLSTNNDMEKVLESSGEAKEESDDNEEEKYEEDEEYKEEKYEEDEEYKEEEARLAELTELARKLSRSGMRPRK